MELLSSEAPSDSARSDPVPSDGASSLNTATTVTWILSSTLLKTNFVAEAVGAFDQTLNVEIPHPFPVCVGKRQVSYFNHARLHAPVEVFHSGTRSQQ